MTLDDLLRSLELQKTILDMNKLRAVFVGGGVEGVQPLYEVADPPPLLKFDKYSPK